MEFKKLNLLLQTLLDVFLYEVVGRKFYVAEKGEIMSQKSHCRNEVIRSWEAKRISSNGSKIG